MANFAAKKRNFEDFFLDFSLTDNVLQRFDSNSDFITFNRFQAQIFIFHSNFPKIYEWAAPGITFFIDPGVILFFF